jgi:amino-acid N-acetyltransferase
MLVRKALLQDASNVYDLVNSLSGDGTLLKRPSPRSAKTFATSPSPSPMAASFWAAARCTFTGRICARCAPSWSSPKPRARARAAAFSRAHRRGRRARHSIRLPVHAHPDFFFKYGFRTVEDKSELPDKIFKDCQNCPRLHRCDEVAMVRGRIPRISILAATATWP